MLFKNYLKLILMITFFFVGCGETEEEDETLGTEEIPIPTTQEVYDSTVADLVTSLSALDSAEYAALSGDIEAEVSDKIEEPYEYLNTVNMSKAYGELLVRALVDEVGSPAERPKVITILQHAGAQLIQTYKYNLRGFHYFEEHRNSMASTFEILAARIEAEAAEAEADAIAEAEAGEAEAEAGEAEAGAAEGAGLVQEFGPLSAIEALLDVGLDSEFFATSFELVNKEVLVAFEAFLVALKPLFAGTDPLTNDELESIAAKWFESEEDLAKFIETEVEAIGRSVVGDDFFDRSLELVQDAEVIEPAAEAVETSDEVLIPSLDAVSVENALPQVVTAYDGSLRLNMLASTFGILGDDTTTEGFAKLLIAKLPEVEVFVVGDFDSIGDLEELSEPEEEVVSAEKVEEIEVEEAEKDYWAAQSAISHYISRFAGKEDKVLAASKSLVVHLMDELKIGTDPEVDVELLIVSEVVEATEVEEDEILPEEDFFSDWDREASWDLAAYVDQMVAGFIVLAEYGAEPEAALVESLIFEGEDPVVLSAEEELLLYTRSIDLVQATLDEFARRGLKEEGVAELSNMLWSIGSYWFTDPSYEQDVEMFIRVTSLGEGLTDCEKLEAIGRDQSLTGEVDEDYIMSYLADGELSDKNTAASCYVLGVILSQAAEDWTVDYISEQVDEFAASASTAGISLNYTRLDEAFTALGEIVSMEDDVDHLKHVID